MPLLKVDAAATAAATDLPIVLAVMQSLISIFPLLTDEAASLTRCC